MRCSPLIGPQRGAGAFEKAVEIFPRHLPSLLGLGKAYEESGRAEAATKVYRGFLDAKPKAEDAAHVRIALGGSGPNDTPTASNRDRSWRSNRPAARCMTA